ncbi:hypothetical protein ABZ690_33520 [Streptomyces sp. NPDC006967]|uniref:hypothetical protein n=1 Tax=unclassified Streptomyces TaxID=2593676 RepID=UPI0015E1B76B|nr:hypothetical protein [Streptomyces sp. SM1]
MTGVDSGAMIIAPTTVAVESVSTPIAAMAEDSVSVIQKAERFNVVSRTTVAEHGPESTGDARAAEARRRLLHKTVHPPGVRGRRSR